MSTFTTEVPICCVGSYQIMTDYSGHWSPLQVQTIMEKLSKTTKAIGLLEERLRAYQTTGIVTPELDVYYREKTMADLKGLDLRSVMSGTDALAPQLSATDLRKNSGLLGGLVIQHYLSGLREYETMLMENVKNITKAYEHVRKNYNESEHHWTSNSVERSLALIEVMTKERMQFTIKYLGLDLPNYRNAKKDKLESTLNYFIRKLHYDNVGYVADLILWCFVLMKRGDYSSVRTKNSYALELDYAISVDATKKYWEDYDEQELKRARHARELARADEARSAASGMD